MPYIINRYDGTELTVLDDGTINSTTSLGLIGRNYFGYGEQQNENFVFLLENFANVTAPPRPLSGQLWFDTSANLLKAYNGTVWTVVGSAIVSDAPPENPTIGGFWFKTPSNTLYVYNGSQWMFIGPEGVEGFGTTRAESTTLLDSTSVLRPVILLKVNGTVISIVSEIQFTLHPTVIISGFSNIAAGVTTSSLLNFRGNLDGISTRARQLQTTRLINGVGFNGTQDINLKSSTSNLLTPGEYIKGDTFDGSTPVTWTVDASFQNIPNKIVVRNSSGDFSARTITANLIGNVQGNVTATAGTSSFNICSANVFEGATLTGNAATATRLQTPRRINGVLFSGVEDITVPASAQTLTGTFINAVVTTSNLQQVGTLQRLTVQDEGIGVGDAAPRLRMTKTAGTPTIYSETGTLKIGAAASPEFEFLNAATAQAQGGPSGFSTIAPVGNSNLGLPARKIQTVYANQLQGNAATATVATAATNISGGSPGALVYQSAPGVTQFLPAGTPGYFLRAAVNNQLQWSTILNENLNRGSGIIFTDIGSNPVNSYNAQSQVTISVDSSSATANNKIVLRNASGDFSTNHITLDDIPVEPKHAVTKQYVDDLVNSIPTGTSNQVKAWVVFNGVNGNILGGHRVTSVNVTGSGKYQINIQSGTFSNGNFAVAGIASDDDHFVVWNNASQSTLVVYTVDAGADSNNNTSTTQGRVTVIMVGP